MKLLIIEDEKELAESMAEYLRAQNYICELAINFRTGLHKIEEWDYDCIILDINLPDGSGLHLLDELKKNAKTDGVIIVSAKHSINDRVQGLHSGADDYLVKPFHLSELAARIAAIIRRKKHDGKNIIFYDDIRIDTQAMEAQVNGQSLELTRKEYQLLLYLITNKGKVIPKNALIDHLWTNDIGYAESIDVVYTHIKNLRKKLQLLGSPDHIKSVYGIGYKMADL